MDAKLQEQTFLVGWMASQLTQAQVSAEDVAEKLKDLEVASPEITLLASAAASAAESAQSLLLEHSRKLAQQRRENSGEPAGAERRQVTPPMLYNPN